MWTNEENRLALLELYQTGRLNLRDRQQEAWRWLTELTWTRLSTRRDQIMLVEERRDELEQLLTRTWPEWRAALDRLHESGLSVNTQGWRTLRDRERAEASGPLPPRLNLRTAIALVGPHSKAGLSVERRQALAEVDLTRDGLVRLRPNAGLTIERNGRALDISLVVDIMHEVVLTERALRDGARLTGILPRALLLVENLGPYLDLCAPEGWLVAHVPGWDTVTIHILLEQMPAIPLVHFGDLDPNGVRIALHLRSAQPRMYWFVPEFWKEFVKDRSLPRSWPESLCLDHAPSLVRDLAKAGLWLEQETIALDLRLSNALEDTLRTSRDEVS